MKRNPSRFIARLLNAGIYSEIEGEGTISSIKFPAIVDAQPHKWADDYAAFSTDNVCVPLPGEIARLTGNPAMPGDLQFPNKPSSTRVPVVSWEMVADVSPENPFAHWNRLKSVGMHA